MQFLIFQKDTYGHFWCFQAYIYFIIQHWPNLHFKGVVTLYNKIPCKVSIFQFLFCLLSMVCFKHYHTYNICVDVKYYSIILLSQREGNALVSAATRGHYDIVQLLLSKGVNAKDEVSMYFHAIHVISDLMTCPIKNQTILIILSCHDQSDCKIQGIYIYITYLPPGGK